MPENLTLPFTAASFNRLLAGHQLMGSRCLHCGALHLPPRAICPHCYSENLEWATLSGKGKLAAFTSIFIGPTFMNQQGYSRSNPYLTGIVELDEGVKISARLVGMDAAKPEEIHIGQPLQVAYLDTGEGEARKTTLAFEPGNS